MDATAEKEWVTAQQLAGLPGMPGLAQNVRRLARVRGWPAKVEPLPGSVRTWYSTAALPEVTQRALLSHRRLAIVPPEKEMPPSVEAPAPDSAALWKRFDDASDAQRAEATRRLEAVLLYRELIDQGCEKGVAASQAGAKSGESERTVRRWNGEIQHVPAPDWLPTLLPSSRGHSQPEEIPAEAWDIFLADYLANEAPAASACYRRLQKIARARGWELPSLNTFRRRLDQLPTSVVVLAREGAEALARTYPAQERDRSGFRALEAVNADGHRFDVFVKDEDGEIFRPVAVVWQDLSSGKILAYEVGRTESRELVRLSFAHMIYLWGIPDDAWLDNGRGFASKWMTGRMLFRNRFKVKEEEPAGIMTQLGIQVHWATPYHGQAKPIERAFRDLCETVSKHPSFAGAYTGNSPTAKPANYGSKAVPIATFHKVLATEIREHNAREGRRSTVCQGRSFDAVFQASYQASPVRQATVEQQRLCLLAGEQVPTDRTDGSVHLMGNRYWNQALVNVRGEKVTVRFDPGQLQTEVYVYTSEGKFLCEAACVLKAGFSDATAAQEHARARNTYKRATRQALGALQKMKRTAVGDLLGELSSEEEETETARPKIVRPIFAPTFGPEPEPDIDVNAVLGRVLNLMSS